MMPTFDCLGPVAFNQPQLLVNGVVRNNFDSVTPPFLLVLTFPVSLRRSNSSSATSPLPSLSTLRRVRFSRPLIYDRRAVLIVLDIPNTAVAPIFASSPTPSQAVVQTVLNAVLASAGVGTYSAACGQALENCVLAALIGGSGCIPAVKGCNILPIQ